MNPNRPTGLTIKRSPKYIALLSTLTLALVAGLFTAALRPSETAQAITPPDSCFDFYSSTGTITDYYDNEGNNSANPSCPRAVDIPSTIGGVVVKSISSDAFRERRLTSVTIPGSVTSIGDFAFYSNQLTSLTILDGMTSISTAAFYGNQLTDLTIPASVTSIGNDAFRSNQLTNPIILGQPTGTYVFLENPLESISYNGTVYPVVTTPSTPVDACFVLDTTTGTITGYRLYDLTALKSGTACMELNVTIPGKIGDIKVTSIQDWAFAGRSLIGLSIPGSVTSIGDFAFYSNEFTSLSIPASVTSIGDYAFSFNYIAELTLPAHLTNLTSYSHAYNSLTRLSIPAEMVTIDPAALMGQNPGGAGSAVDILRSDNPAIVQQAYDSIWYVRAYTSDPSNPHSLNDFAISEEEDSVKDRNQNGTKADSLGGHIINPASTVVKYQDKQGNEVAPSVTITGLKTGKSTSSSLDSADYLHSYLVAESAISAPLDPYGPTPEERAAMELGFSQYYRIGDSVTFSPKDIAGYTTPSAQTVTLSDEDNVVTFTYAPHITSVSFKDNAVIDGQLTSPATGSTQHPLMASSSLRLTDASGSAPSDCSQIQSASLLAASEIVARPAEGVNLLGGLDFSLLCTTGGQTGVSYTLGSAVPDTSKLVAYKYNTATGQLTDITNKVTISNQVVNGQPRTVISYSLLDGGELDEDGVANGTIADPLVIGYRGELSGTPAGGGLADTGVSFWLTIAAPITALGLGAGLLLATSRRKA